MSRLYGPKDMTGPMKVIYICWPVAVILTAHVVVNVHVLHMGLIYSCGWAGQLLHVLSAQLHQPQFTTNHAAKYHKRHICGRWLKGVHVSETFSSPLSLHPTAPLSCLFIFSLALLWSESRCRAEREKIEVRMNLQYFTYCSMYRSLANSYLV